MGCISDYVVRGAIRRRVRSLDAGPLRFISKPRQRVGNVTFGETLPARSGAVVAVMATRGTGHSLRFRDAHLIPFFAV